MNNQKEVIGERIDEIENKIEEFSKLITDMDRDLCRYSTTEKKAEIMDFNVLSDRELRIRRTANKMVSDLRENLKELKQAHKRLI